VPVVRLDSDETASAYRRIDMHMHAITPRYLSAFMRATGLDSVAGAPAWSAEQHLAVMDRYETRLAVVSVPPPGVFYGDCGEARELAREINEEYARLVVEHPGRFAALACLPLPDVEASLQEIRYALDDLGLDGVGLFSNVAGTYLGASAFEPVLQELDRRGSFVFVHPAPPVTAALERYPVWLMELPFDTTRSIVDLLYSGALERYRRIRFLFPHLGGTVPYLAHRLATLVAREEGWTPSVPRGPLHYLERLSFDTAQSDNRPALHAALAFTDAANVVYGSDWPYAVMGAEPDPQPGLAELAEGRRDAIEWSNAAGLMPELTRHLT
jgi:predicted TIM-barrel fold metal-dependent hydrolase